MGTILKFPPRITHLGKRPEQEEQSLILSQALANLRVPRAASKLMVFYASQGYNFRPSLKVISEATGIDPYNISRTRQVLVQRGLIAYTGQEVVIDWARLRAFASMNRVSMGVPSKWTITPAPVSHRQNEENDLHNYIGVRDSASERLRLIYEATAQAVKDGVPFPELSGVELPPARPVTPLIKENDLHNYIGDGDFASWYNPFDEPLPAWVYQLPMIDAYGEIVGYAHYNTILPF
jgi:hypothetical protein